MTQELDATVVPAWYVPHGHPQRHLSVKVVQRKLGLEPTGIEDAEFEATLRGFARARGIDSDTFNVLTPALATELGPREGGEGVPLWWAGEGLFYEYSDDLHDHGIVGVPALRRFQSEHSIPPSGIVDRATAELLYQFE